MLTCSGGLQTGCSLCGHPCVDLSGLASDVRHRKEREELQSDLCFKTICASKRSALQNDLRAGL